MVAPPVVLDPVGVKPGRAGRVRRRRHRPGQRHNEPTPLASTPIDAPPFVVTEAVHRHLAAKIGQHPGRRRSVGDDRGAGDFVADAVVGVVVDVPVA